MQNKGFIRIFSIALALVCIFYLSFTFVTSRYDTKAKDFAQGDSELYYKYIDSVAGERVWPWAHKSNWGYTLKECREKEINLGLDLKGGMNVTLEVSVPDILVALSNHNSSENFNKAIDAAKKRKSSDFLSAFREEFEKIAPNEQLSPIFSTLGLKDKITLSSTNAQVIDVLRKETQAAIDNSFNVLSSRIDRFGVVQPNVQKIGGAEGRILVELPGIKEPERVRKLLQGSANLEFWETYSYKELATVLNQANAALKDILAVGNRQDTTQNIVAETTENIVAEVKDTAKTALDSLAQKAIAAQSTETTAPEQGDEAARAKWEKDNPLFALLAGGQSENAPRLGLVAAKDTSKVMAYFNLPQIKRLLPRELSLRWTVKPESVASKDDKHDRYGLIALKVTNREGRAPLTGDVVTDARNDFDQIGGGSIVNMKMNAEGAAIWSRLTEANVGKAVAISLDNYIYSYPNVNQKIDGGSSQISGNFTPEEAKDLANVLKSGKMPAPAKIVQEDVVGPSLGQDAINKGLISFAISLFLIFVYMIMYYGVIPGLIADIVLIANTFFLLGILASFNAVLTLPGIAGIVLTLGMAVDANVLIYERCREELIAGKNLKKAVEEGFGNALSAIIDGQVTTLLIGIILFIFGTGSVKGFATTLVIGIFTSLFTALFFSRMIFDRLVNMKREWKISFTTELTKNWFKGFNFDFIGKKKYGYIFSLTLCAIFIAALVFNKFESGSNLYKRGAKAEFSSFEKTLGLDKNATYETFKLGSVLKEGIDFSGGNTYIVRFENEILKDKFGDNFGGKFAETVREKLDDVFTGYSLFAITMGNENQIRISTNFVDENTDDNITIETMLYDNLREYLNPAVTQDMFVKRYVVNDGTYELANIEKGENYGIQSSQSVGPTIASDMLTRAFWAVILSLVVIFVYILVRFKNYSYSVGSVASLFHDAFFMIGIYAICYRFMPFSLDLDQSFIAAILTIIGYSINDTVVIFDRVRENLGLYPKRSMREQMNNALNATLSRTFSTSFTVMLTLLAMFIFGGEVIRGFMFALLMGTVSGVYSTLFIAVPLAYDIKSEQKGVEKK
ncbi:MAG: protein translocase subunit SecD [Prevotellaceae bacterium]|jgi:SecD/SecF fusion protein|nr:protein translocase subunit SecD [Prevotellaceae bacterium]